VWDGGLSRFGVICDAGQGDGEDFIVSERVRRLDGEVAQPALFTRNGAVKARAQTALDAQDCDKDDVVDDQKTLRTAVLKIVLGRVPCGLSRSTISTTLSLKTPQWLLTVVPSAVVALLSLKTSRPLNQTIRSPRPGSPSP
jgi:hypothetical protein